MNHYQILCTFQGNGAIDVYKKQPNTQLSFDDFNQPVRLTLIPKILWVKKPDLFPWLPWTTTIPPFSKPNRPLFPPLSPCLLPLFCFKRILGPQLKTRSSIPRHPLPPVLLPYPCPLKAKPFFPLTLGPFSKPSAS